MIMDKKVKQRSDLEECATSSSQVHEKSFSKMLFIHLRRSTSLLLGSVLKCDWSKTEWVALRTTITHYCCLEHTILSIHIAHLSCKKKNKTKNVFKWCVFHFGSWNFSSWNTSVLNGAGPCAGSEVGRLVPEQPRASKRRLQWGVQLLVVVTGAVAVAALRAGVVCRLLQPQQHVHLQSTEAWHGKKTELRSCDQYGLRHLDLHKNPFFNLIKCSTVAQSFRKSWAPKKPLGYVLIPRIMTREEAPTTLKTKCGSWVAHVLMGIWQR